MSVETYEEELQPIPGDIFLDRILGWLSLSCGIPILGFAIYRYLHPNVKLDLPAWVEPARIALIVLGLMAIYAITRSTRPGYGFALVAFIVRTLGALALYPWSGGPRYASSEILFDVVVIGYCLLRLKHPGPPH